MNNKKSMISVLIAIFIIFSTMGTTFGAAVISISMDKDTADVGDQVVITVTITNTGPENLANIKVNAPLPDGLQYLSHATDVDKVDYTSGVWNVGNLKFSSKGGGVKHLYITTEVLNESAGKIITTHSSYKSVSYNDSGVLTPVDPLPESNSVILKVNKIDNSNSTNNSSKTSDNKNNSIATSTDKKTDLIKALNDTIKKENTLDALQNLNNSSNQKSYEISNNTNPNTPPSSNTIYAILGVLGIGTLVAFGYFKGFMN